MHEMPCLSDNIFAGTLRPLLSGTATLREGRVLLRVEAVAHSERLMAVEVGQMASNKVDGRRRELHRDFERALGERKLLERPDCEGANLFLVRARRWEGEGENDR